MDNARYWLTRCQNDHPDCARDLKMDEDMSEPPSHSWIRLLELCEEKLRLTPVKLGEGLPPYVALSHCWGSCPTLKLLSTNFARFLVGIERCDLPSTFKDAVKMTKLLGFDYIWIDSLCIIQDSPTDWEEQSSLMASVYGNADLVIAASSASSTEDGFLKERKGYRDSTLRLSSLRNQGHTLNLRYRLLQPKRLAPMVDPLNRRAWALQERLLARRYLAIGSHDTSWTCMTSMACECEWWRVASIWRDDIRNVKRLVQDATVAELGGFWRRRVLGHYFGRGLTVPSDNLVALSAIASTFQKKMRSKYHAGIWQDDLLPGLLWYSFHPETGYGSNHSAPSWSWASLPTLDVREQWVIVDCTEAYAQARVLETNTIMSTLNQFGSVCAGFIKLWGRLWRVEATASELSSEDGDTHLQLEVKGYFKNDFLLAFDTSLIMVKVCLFGQSEENSLRRVRREEVKNEFYIGNVEQGKNITLSMVPLLEHQYSSQRTDIVGLILGRSPKDPTKFERIGWFHTRNLTVCGPDENNEQELVII